MEHATFRLAELIDDLAGRLSAQADDRSVELLLTMPVSLPDRLTGDADWLLRALADIAQRVIDGAQSGEVVIRVEECGRKDGVLSLQFVVLHPGSDADPVVLPASFHFEASEDGAALAVGGVPLRGRRALIVDDNALVARTLGDMARDLGLQVEIAADGWDALRAATLARQAGRPFDLIFVDWRMPGMDGVSCARQLRGHAGATAPILVMATGFGGEEAVAQAKLQRVDIQDVLVKPVTPDRLVRASLAALRARPAASPTASPAATATRAGRRFDGLHLLLVEDNPISQELALDLLQRAGAKVSLAAHGREALDALSTVLFDGVLMDLQMPVMDGLEATRLIRANPRWHGLPIIAMTAAGLASDRDRVLAAGMNDHVPKPIDAEKLFAALARCVRPDRNGGSTPLPVFAPAAPPAGTDPMQHLPGIDVAIGRASTMGNERLYRRLLLKFRDAQHDIPERLEAAWSAGDKPAARRLAHDLAGVSGTLGAQRVHLAARAIEVICAGEGDAEALPGLLEDARQALAPVMAGLRGLPEE